jgi:hypothetical protein
VDAMPGVDYALVDRKKEGALEREFMESHEVSSDFLPYYILSLLEGGLVIITDQQFCSSTVYHSAELVIATSRDPKTPDLTESPSTRNCLS